MEGISRERLDLLRLRARVVVLERAVLASLEVMLRVRPEQLSTMLDIARKHLEKGYLDETFAPDLSDPQEREYVAKEVERLMRALQADMGFQGGISSPEDG